MKNLVVAGLVMLLAMPTVAQDIDSLNRRLADALAENARLRERIEVLERELTPRAATALPAIPPVAATSARPDDGNDGDDVERALERALVREGGLLLSPSRFELEPNFVYSHQRGVTGATRDAFGPGLVMRKGLPWRSQVEVALPYVWERRGGAAPTSTASGVGDLSVGLAHQFLVDRRGGVPSLIGALGLQADNGRNTVFQSSTPVALGSGFRAVTASLTAVKRVDPMVYFGSYGVRHSFAAEQGGIRVQPGGAHTFRLGAALAVSPATSLRTAFSLSMFQRTRLDGVPLQGSDETQASLELGGSVTLDSSRALDVVVAAGLNRFTPSYRLTIALPIRF